MRIKFKTVKQFIALSILMKSAIACSSDDLYLGGETQTHVTKGEVGTQETTDIFTDSTKNGAIVLNPAPVGNPYNVDTLKKAYTLLYPNGNGQAGMPGFHPTHYQVRLLPVDSVEFAALMASDLVLTTIPLDKKVSGEGTYYFDPVLEAQGAPYTWQYAIVPVTQELPNMRHEIVAEICAPNDGSKGRSANGTPDIWPALEAKAYEMCGEEMPPKVQSRGIIGGGMPGDYLKRVLVWDDKANQYIPAKGAKVVVFSHNWSAWTATGENGYYDHLFFSLPRGPIVRMEIQWADFYKKWIISDHVPAKLSYKLAIYSCPMVNGIRTYRIKGGKQQTFATVTRALYRFYHQYNQSLPVPNGASWVLCIDGYSKDGYAGLYSPNETIRIWGKDKNNNYRLSNDIFATTAHELGHMIHYKNIISNTKNWNKTEKIIIESWTRFVEWTTTEYEYNELGRILGRPEPLTFVTKSYLPSLAGFSGPPGQPGQPSYKFYNTPNGYNFQDWPKITTPSFTVTDYGIEHIEYSPLLIDLMDTDNQSDYYRAFGVQNIWPAKAYTLYPNDLVSGYTVAELRQALSTATNLSQFKENIKNVRYNSDANKIKIDTLFNRYVYYWGKYK